MLIFTIYTSIYNQDLQGRGTGVNTSLRVRHSPPGYPLKAPFRTPWGTMGLLRPKYWEIYNKKHNKKRLFSQGLQFSQIFSEKNAARSWVLISYLHRWTSIYVYLCPEMAKMIAQICKNRRKSKGIPIHNGGGLRPPPTKVGGGLRPPPTFVGTIMDRYSFTFPPVLAYLGYNLGHLWT